MKVQGVDAKTVRAVMSTWGRLGGLTKSETRARASRENGKLGDRPKGSKNKRKAAKP
jgi:hypothetical protein